MKNIDISKGKIAQRERGNLNPPEFNISMPS